MTNIQQNGDICVKIGCCLLWLHTAAQSTYQNQNHNFSVYKFFQSKQQITLVMISLTILNCQCICVIRPTS